MYILIILQLRLVTLQKKRMKSDVEVWIGTGGLTVIPWTKRAAHDYSNSVPDMSEPTSHPVTVSYVHLTAMEITCWKN